MTDRYAARTAVIVCGLLLSGPAAALAFNATDVTLGAAGASYTRYYSMDNVPFVYDTGTFLGVNEYRKFRYGGSRYCGGLDARVDLPVIGTLNGQSLYRLTEDTGLLVWAGDTKFTSARALSGNNWTDVFHQWCSSDSQGYSVYVRPVILKRSATRQYFIPFTTVGSIRLRGMNGSVFTGRTAFMFSLNSMVLNNGARSCTLQTPASTTVPLPAISSMSLPRTGDEIFAGMTRTGLNCEPGVAVYATLTDSTNPANRSDILTLTPSSTATGVGLKIYKNEETTALRFGPDSPVRGNENQWKLSAGRESFPSVQLKVRYVNTGGTLTPGTVNGVSTITFSYQ
ncbi:fimbrial protein [Salmonella enterica subsp. enterica]|nr:fimbrial protein [Salmonella enterica subsp. enterica serovar Eastbourne]EDR2881884.1 fimbrial protein [Salmonella enterica subsp. enterica]